jgi:hypothetical protein
MPGAAVGTQDLSGPSGNGNSHLHQHDRLEVAGPPSPG